MQRVLLLGKKNKTSLDYSSWKAKHVCEINHRGSAAVMEPSGAVCIFQNSEVVRGLRCTKYLGDGDSSSFTEVVTSDPCDGKTIEKVECVGQVQKHCEINLRQLKSANKGIKVDDGKRLSGVGRLKDKVLDTLQNDYGLAIRQNAASIEKMKEGVNAVLPHTASSASNPIHGNCP